MRGAGNQPSPTQVYGPRRVAGVRVAGIAGRRPGFQRRRRRAVALCASSPQNHSLAPPVGPIERTDRLFGLNHAAPVLPCRCPAKPDDASSRAEGRVLWRLRTEARGSDITMAVPCARRGAGSHLFERERNSQKLGTAGCRALDGQGGDESSQRRGDPPPFPTFHGSH